ncbi:hypothetical protein M9H77_31263 [Catharanthus roseus]|uniref:Uncharacterized protein n=1 Tax=Catharanthus roseus TaxID=4058 RepID=A0ACC0A3H7_CATRO|nr:hypothetical protein M9H77_31263 [Catharanthus roseus]
MLPNELGKERCNSIECFYDKLLFTSSLMKIINEAQEDVFPVFYKKRVFLPISKTCILDTLLEIRKLSKASKTLSRILGFQDGFSSCTRRTRRLSNLVCPDLEIEHTFCARRRIIWKEKTHEEEMGNGARSLKDFARPKAIGLRFGIEKP